MIELKPNREALIERTYDVLLDEVLVGYVHPTWKREGGNGWTWRHAASNRTGYRVATRRDAVRRLLIETRA